MQQCQSCLKETAIIERGILVCLDHACNYVDYNPISYENDVNDYDAEERTLKRFSEIETPYQNQAEGPPIHEDNFDSNFFRGKKYISDCGFSLQLSEVVINQAESLLLHILKILQKEKQIAIKQSEQTEATSSKKEVKGQRFRNKNTFSVRSISAYSIFSVCFEKEIFFEEYNIINYFKIEIKQWRQMTRDLNSILRNYLQFVPICQPKHIILKICKKRNICIHEQLAMIEMCERIMKYSTIDVRSPTIAAISFWKICQFSKRYKNRIVLSHLCRSHERLIAKGKANSTYSFFDITPENVRKVYKEHIKSDLLTKYLPEWENRIQIANNNIGSLDDLD